MSKALTKEEMSLNAHVEDLRERMRMLQNDRTANIDVLEANKAANKEEIKMLRGDNKDFRQKLAQLQRVSTFYIGVVTTFNSSPPFFSYIIFLYHSVYGKPLTCLNL